MTITKLFPSGAVEVSDIINGYLVRRIYYGYTKREAARMFRAETKGAQKCTGQAQAAESN